MAGIVPQQSALETLKIQQPGAIVRDIARARGRASLRFRLIFFATWIIVIGALAIALVGGGKVHTDFLAEWAPFILGGAPVSIFVSVCSIALAVVFALFGALGRLSRVAPIYALATLYVSLVRGTPLIVQIFFVYLALPEFGLVIDPLQGGILTLAFNYGAYMTEIFRAGILAVGPGQTEAADALGMTYRQRMRRVVLPQAFKIVIPPIGNEFIAMMKDTALVGFLGTPVFYWDLFKRGQTLGSQSFKPLEALIVAAGIYWALTIIFSYFQSRLEARVSRGYVRDAGRPAYRRQRRGAPVPLVPPAE
jgi:polar amino acid transport system permease protein